MATDGYSKKNSYQQKSSDGQREKYWDKGTHTGKRSDYQSSNPRYSNSENAQHKDSYTNYKNTKLCMIELSRTMNMWEMSESVVIVEHKKCKYSHSLSAYTAEK